MRAWILLSACCLPGLALPQHWRALGVGPLIGGAVQVMADTLEDRVLICGNFNYCVNEDDTVQCCGVAQWRGARWDSVAHRMWNTQSVMAIDPYWLSRFEDRLFICGGVSIESGLGAGNAGFLRLNEQSLRWEPLICPNPFWSTLSFVVPRETAGQPYVYLTGEDWTLCGFPQASVFRYDGASISQWPPWSEIPVSDDGNLVTYVFEYRDHVYVCGIIDSPIDGTPKNMLRHNGTAWEHVPGYNGGIIKDISIHRDTLYVAGGFQNVGGPGGDGVAAFDGDQWFPLGDGLLFQPSPGLSNGHSLRWFHDELYVGGGFTMAGGIPANGYAKWDRHQWCSLPGFDEASFSSGYRKVLSMAVWRDSLYVQGQFTSLEGEPIRHLAQWIGGDAVTDCSDPVGIREDWAVDFIVAAPNPSNGIFRLDNVPADATRIDLRDGMGRLVRSELIGNGSYDISALPAGLYYALVLDKLGTRLARAPVVKR